LALLRHSTVRAAHTYAMPRYNQGDETDEYLRDITGAARAQPDDYAVRDPMAEQGCCSERCTKSGCVLSALNIILLACGGLLIAAGIMTKSNSHFNTICSYCDHGAYGIIGLGSFVVVLSLAGLMAALSFSKFGRCIGGVYMVVMIIFSLVAVASVVLVVLLKENKLDSHIKDAWVDEVKDNPSDVCKVQHDFKCSGWETCCTPACFGGNMTALPEGCPVTCFPNPEYNNYTESCHDKVHEKVDDWFPWLLVGTLAFLLVSSLSCCLSCKTVCDPEKGRRKAGYVRVNEWA